jgi:hypothetical protein
MMPRLMVEPSTDPYVALAPMLCITFVVCYGCLQGSRSQVSPAMVNPPPTYKLPTTCAFCGQPFRMHDNHVYAWRSTRANCSEFCADDKGEAAFQNRRRA